MMVKSFRIAFFCLVVSLTIISCVNPPNYPNQPVITYEGVNKTSVYQGVPGLPKDTLAIFFSFTDGDGDLSTQDSTDLFLFDSRFPSISSLYKIPAIPDEGTGNGIRGEITVRILSTNTGICCIDNGFACPNNPSIATDTFSYEIQIKDRAGNLSNKIRTETLTILCQ